MLTLLFLILMLDNNDKERGHILTGDSSIVKNSKLHKVICKEPRFREKNKSICIKLDKRIDVLRNVSYINNSPLLQNFVTKQALTELYNKYVLVLVDKAIGFAAIICQKFYGSALIKELGLDRDPRNGTNSTYETCNHIQEDLLIAKHSKDFCNN